MVFDSHFHIIDPRFPLVGNPIAPAEAGAARRVRSGLEPRSEANAGYVPEPFTCADYRARARGLAIAGGAVVSGSFQAFDQGYLRAALAELGPSFVGVTQLPASVGDDEIRALDEAGVRAVRFNLRRGGSEGIAQLDALARRVHEVAGWHAELYVDARELDGLMSTLRALPAVSLDHLGLSRDGFRWLLALAERGVRVKASGFGRVDFDIAQALRDLWAANPACLMFGTDLPSTRAPVPFRDSDIDLVRDTFDEAAAARILYGNAASFYRVPATGAAADDGTGAAAGA